MADSFIPYGADPGTVGRRAATAKRNMTRDTVTADFHHDEVVVVERKIITFRGAGATFRIAGLASTPHNLWSIENAAGSTVLVALRYLNMYTVATAASATLVTPALFRITTLPTGGTTFTKTSKDSRETSNASVAVRGASSADGTASAITATAAGQRLTSALQPTMVTSGVYTALGKDLIMAEEYPYILNAGQAYLLQNITASAVTVHYVVECAWEEFTEF